MDHVRERVLTADNIEREIANFAATLNGLGTGLTGLDGIPLLEALKRTPLQAGPYREITLFEAANRIMTDLVLLYGVRFLLKQKDYPYTAYTVEFGNEDENGYDVTARDGERWLAGEAFNVAGTFFQQKKSRMVAKLSAAREDDATDTVLIFNHDAVDSAYRPFAGALDRHLAVNVTTGEARWIEPRVRRTAKAAPASLT